MARILLVDDQALALEVLKDFLEEEGHTVVTAFNGAEAWELLQNDPNFDLVISDNTMPKMKGEQLLGEVRKRYPVLPFILYTGNPDPAVREFCSRNGAVLEPKSADGDIMRTVNDVLRQAA